MSKKTKNGKMTKRERNEHLTNWYMINFCWGVVGIVALFAVYQGYRNMNFILTMQPLMWVMTGVFAAGTVVLWILGNAKKSKRMNHYAILTGVCTLVSLWLAVYNKIRPLLETIARTVLRDPNLAVSSYWNVWIPMIGIGIYLIVAFVYFAITVTRK